ncbi:MAG: nickel pincer cofactor biosynthesis protein LarC [Actinomycetota bacterium]|nr:nickel pincer cofactor biosynthesis protein LarC [Actinomycetota bacterium]
MRTLYLDAFSGISGDMTLGALADLGVPLEVFREVTASLGLNEVEITAGRTERKSIAAIKVQVRVPEKGVVRTYANIRSLIDSSPLPGYVIEKSLKVFALLAKAESCIHSRSIDQVHFHELGGEDTLVDVVGGVAGLGHLGVEELLCSPLPLGTGRIKTAHGMYPVPVPAVAEILRDIPVYSSGIPTEIVTPTGAAMVAALASDFCSLPSMRVQSVGYGAGDRDLEIPNVLRAFLGERAELTRGRIRERRLIFSTNIDDMNPELYAYVMEKLFAAGAEDVWLVPVQMKKSRPAVTLKAMAAPALEEEIKELIFAETKTVGMRISVVDKEYLDREIIHVSTPFGDLRVKVARRENKPVNLAPEYEDCRTAATKHGVPLKDVYSAAEEAARTYMASLSLEREPAGED